MKEFTDVEQSKKLQEILPLESANMYYRYILPKSNKIEHTPKYGNPAEALEWYNKGYTKFGKEPLSLKEYCIPCWSLAALMEILNGAAFTRDGTAPECYEATIFYTDEAPTLKRMTCTGTSYVDACYNMIKKLNEMNILSLPKTMEEQS
jgi:hypothetical protein